MTDPAFIFSVGDVQGVVVAGFNPPAPLFPVQLLRLVHRRGRARRHQPRSRPLAVGSDLAIDPSNLEGAGQAQSLGLNPPIRIVRPGSFCLVLHPGCALRAGLLGRGLLKPFHDHDS